MTACRTTRVKHSHRRAGGFAMLLVMIMVGAAFVLGMSYLNAQSTSTSMMENKRRQAMARYIAESGLDMAVEEVKGNPDWRTDQTSGTWVTNYALAGGTVTIAGVDEDGDLEDASTDPVALTAIGSFQGVTYRTAAAVSFGDGAGGGGGYGITTTGMIETKNSALVDSFDSSLGPYGGANIGAEAKLATTSIASNKVVVGSATTIKGDVFVGVGGDPDVVVNVKGTLTGGKFAMSDDPQVPPVAELPPGFPANEGSKTFSHGTTTISTDRHFDDLVIGNNATVRINGDVTLRVNKKFEIKNNASLEILPDSSLKVYVEESIVFDNNAKVNENTALPGNMVVFSRGSGYEHSIVNRAQVYAIIDAPSSSLKLQNHVGFYGAFMGTDLLIENNAAFHVDTNPALGQMNLRLPTGSGSPQVRVRWLENPY